MTARARKVTRGLAMAAALAAALALGYLLALWRNASHDVQQTKRAPPASVEQEKKPLYWYDPMHPEARFDRPGPSPFMDMDLVPKYAGTDEPAGEAGTVTIQPHMVQNLGIRTAVVTRMQFAQQINAVGAVGIDERNLVAVEARTGGWVEELYVRTAGDPVRRGQRLAAIYSPQLYAAQSELLVAIRAKDPILTAAARQRLELWGVSKAQIENVISSGKPQRRMSISAPADGIVTELNVREGQQIAAAAPLMRIADLSRVWVLLEIPETQAGGIEPGQQAEARVQALPGRRFTGKVDYVYPTVEAETRTVSARVVVDNRDAALKPGMYAEVTVFPQTQSESLVVPAEAVIRTGERSVVIVARDGQRFVPTPVSLGAQRGEHIVVQEGLEEGQRVVVSGQFLIDSEAALRGAFTRMEDAPAEHDHEHRPNENEREHSGTP